MLHLFPLQNQRIHFSHEGQYSCECAAGWFSSDGLTCQCADPCQINDPCGIDKDSRNKCTNLYDTNLRTLLVLVVLLLGCWVVYCMCGVEGRREVK